MAAREEVKNIANLRGVDQYILVHQNGKIADHNLPDPETIAGMIVSCGNTSYAIGKTRFQYLVFPRKSQRDIFIFPVGKYYLGVIKQKETDRFVLANNVINYLTNLL